RSIEPSGANLVFSNKMEGQSTGVEGWGTLHVTEDWRLSAGGLIQNQELELASDSADPLGVRAAGNDPDYQWMLRSAVNVTRQVEFDVALRHVAKLPDPSVPAYTAIDMRLGWRPRPDVELSLAGQNLFDPQHPEVGTAAARSELARSVYGKITWRF
ncbi:MAG: TonB-dependent receptor, partial [Burkholderiales bacterium]